MLVAERSGIDSMMISELDALAAIQETEKTTRVTPSSLAACLNPPSFATAYMCFYVKRHLDYRPHSVPSYATLAKENGSPTKAVEAEDP